MDSDELRKLLQQKESAKLDFKSKMYELEGKEKTKYWNELVKDIIAIANGNIGTANEKGYLIIGAADALKDDGTREIYDIDKVTVAKRQILDKVGAICEPPFQNLDCETINLDGKRLFVITIPPSDYLYVLKKQLQSFPQGSVILRRLDGEQTYKAEDEERFKISREKENRQKSESELYKKLTNYQYIKTEIQGGQLSQLLDDYTDALKPIHSLSEEQRENLCLVQATLRSSEEVLTSDVSQLASQLVGRLYSSENLAIQRILREIEDLEEEQGQSWLKPLSNSLKFPIASLHHTLKGGKKPIQVIAVDPSSSNLVSAYVDGTLEIWDLNSGKRLRSWKGHDRQINTVAITPENNKLVSASDDCTLKIWDINTSDLLFSLEEHEGEINEIAITPDGQQVISASDDSTLRIWDLASGNLLDTQKCNNNDAVTSVVVTDDGQYIAFAVDATIKILQQDSNYIIHSIPAHGSRINFLRLFPDRNSLISASDDETLKIWNLDQKPWDLDQESDQVTLEYLVKDAVITFDGKSIIFITDDDSLIRIWHWETDEVDLLEGHQQLINALTIVPDRKRIITASNDPVSDDEIIYIWDLASKQKLATLRGHNKPVNAITIAPNGHRFVSASEDKTLKVWNFLDTQSLSAIAKHTDKVNTIVIDRNGTYAVSASRDKTLKLWNIYDGTCLKTFQADGLIDPLLIDEQRVFFASDEDNSLFIQDFLSENAEPKRLVGHSSIVNEILLTPDGQYAVSASEDNEDNLSVWSLDTGDLHKKLEGHSAPIQAITIDPNKQWLISASINGTLKIWHLEDFKLLYTFTGESEFSRQFNRTINITPRGRFFISESDNTDLNILDLSTGELLFTLKERKDQVTAIAITLDCKQLISTDANNTLDVWDVQSDELLYSLGESSKDSSDSLLPAHSPTINSIIITPCDRYVVSTSDDRTVKVWDFKTKDLVGTFTGDSEMTACAVAPNGTIIAGERSGRVHFLALQGV